MGAYNDYRRGDGNCGAAFSGNGGQNWTDTTLPTGFTRGTAFGGVAREYWQGGGDASVAWDSRGGLDHRPARMPARRGVADGPAGSMS